MHASTGSDDDPTLLRRAATDPDAFAVFYRRHAVALERWIRAQTPDMATAADLTAETFAQALISAGRFRGNSEEAARGWLYGIARNLIRRYLRHGRVELATCQKLAMQLRFDPDELERIDAQIDAAAQAGELKDALSRLPASQRQALELRVLDDLDYRDVAALMASTEVNARARVSRALKALSLRLGGTAR
jgi:RNA polymerase sigma factor (sigma-70 family)